MGGPLQGGCSTYVTAHAYYPDAIRMAVENGVSCIEHGNLIDAPTAKLMAEKGAILVPTLVTYTAMAEMGERLGLPKINLEKNKTVLAGGLESLEIAKAAGVEMAFGTDLIGETEVWQNREFAIRAEVLSPLEILHSMYVVGPRLLKREGEVGVLAPGAMQDVVVTNVNPLEDIAALANPERSLSHVVKVELVRSLTDPVAYYVVGEWLTEQSYANWQAVSMVEADQDALVAMRATLVDHAPGRLFSMVSRSK
jgi:imidazolonepropionase-like amidohydrolase